MPLSWLLISPKNHTSAIGFDEVDSSQGAAYVSWRPEPQAYFTLCLCKVSSRRCIYSFFILPHFRACLEHIDSHFLPGSRGTWTRIRRLLGIHVTQSLGVFCCLCFLNYLFSVNPWFTGQRNLSLQCTLDLCPWWSMCTLGALRLSRMHPTLFALDSLPAHTATQPCCVPLINWLLIV